MVGSSELTAGLTWAACHNPLPTGIPMLSALMLTTLLSPTAAADEPPEDGFSMGALPAVNYNSDEGFGYGAIGTGYWYRDGLMPYKYALTLRFFMTTKKIHAHMIRLDALDVGGLPLRVTAEAGYFTTLAANFCGYAGDTNCGPDADAIALAAGEATGLTDEGELETFAARYYRIRYTEPYGVVNLRWKLKDKPHRVEVMGGYRGSYYFPGTPQTSEPWPDSLYAGYNPEGETGFSSTVQAGMMFDNRDNEPAPNSGYWHEASIRGAGPFTGSDWTYFGTNITLRQYATLIPDKVVSATRLVGDATWGDMATMDMVRFGGSRDFSGIGGQYGGRGLRAWRYIGQVKVLGQQELRYTFARISPGDQDLAFGLVGFLDYGFAAQDFANISTNDTGYGTGAGLRVTWNQNFVVRVDSGFSPVEDWGQKLYINLDHVF